MSTELRARHKHATLLSQLAPNLEQYFDHLAWLALPKAQIQIRIEELLKQYPEDPRVYYMFALFHAKNGQNKQAVMLLQTALTKKQILDELDNTVDIRPKILSLLETIAQ